MNAIILHGTPDKEEYYSLKYPAQSNSHWIPWIQKQLQVKDIFTQTPEMPMSFKPDYNIWKKEFECYDIGSDTILVGHSCGAGFIVRWLSENQDAKVGKVVLVSPWLNPFNDQKHKARSFFDFKIDSGISSRTRGITVFYSDDDFKGVSESVDTLKNKVRILNIKQLKGYGHFCYKDMGTIEFPELLEEIVGR